MSSNKRRGVADNFILNFINKASFKKAHKNMQVLNIGDSGISKLIDRTGIIKIVNTYNVKKDDIVILEAGEIIPFDGYVVEGLALVDESAITGESVPVIKEADGYSNFVINGTRLVSNWLKIRVTKTPLEIYQERPHNNTNLNAL